MHQRSASTSGRNSIEVRLEERTVWLTHTLISEFYQTTIFTINIPIGNIFKGGELNAGSGIKKYVTTAADGKSYRITYYNPIMILAISYQV